MLFLYLLMYPVVYLPPKLWSLLFVLYINDLTKLCSMSNPNSVLYLSADDPKLFSDNCFFLQNSLN